MVPALERHAPNSSPTGTRRPFTVSFNCPKGILAKQFVPSLAWHRHGPDSSDGTALATMRREVASMMLEGCSCGWFCRGEQNCLAGVFSLPELN